jgi:methyl-accepting chemotaxis protein
MEGGMVAMTAHEARTKDTLAPAPEPGLREELALAVVACTPNPIMVCDRELVIRYVNPASLRLLERIAGSLPVPVAKVQGSNLDVFHQGPERVRRLLVTPERLPYETRIQLGPEILEMKLFALRSASGDYLGPAVAWQVITSRAQLEARDRQTLGELGAIIDHLGGAALTLGQVSTQLASGSSGLVSRAAQVLTTTESVKGHSATVASAADELSATIEGIARSAAESAKVSRRAREQARSATDAIEVLAANSVDIGKVTQTIALIAEQTNVLAFNATIEAARAGDSGKGFAVVASEVKALAQATARSSREIAARVQVVGQNTRKSVEAIQGVVAVMDEVDTHAASIAGAVTEQAAAVKHIAEHANQVAAAMNEVGQVLVGVTEAAKASEQQAAITRRSSAAIDGLAGQLRDVAGAAPAPVPVARS